MSIIDNLEFKMCKMSTSEDRGREPLYKPQVASPRCRGELQNRGVARNIKQSQSYSSPVNGSFRQSNNGSRPQNSSQGSSSHGRYSGYALRSERNMSGYG